MSFDYKSCLDVSDDAFQFRTTPGNNYNNMTSTFADHTTKISSGINKTNNYNDWIPNGNTTAGVVRLSLLALSAAIHATSTLHQEKEDDVDGGGLALLPSATTCPVMKYHLEWIKRARFSILKVQDFYWKYVHNYDDDDDGDDDDDDDDENSFSYNDDSDAYYYDGDFGYEYYSDDYDFMHDEDDIDDDDFSM
jgi:hypothetical protein